MQPGQPASQRESAVAIDDAAMVWAARIDRGLSPEEEAQLARWTSNDSRRTGALARAMAANSYFDRAAALGAGFQPAPKPALSRRKFFLGGVGVLAASVVGGIGLALLSRPERIGTAMGDVRRVAMPEGSAITLNTDSAIEPLFDDDARRVTLVRGEALFDVAKDRARPFTVQAGDTVVRAIGTSFTVRLHKDGRVGVVVYEGVVEVRREDQPPLRLAAGFATQPGDSREMRARPVSVAELDRTLAWRNGRLDLTGLTLGEAAAEFARYSPYRIHIPSPMVAQMRVTGVYSTTDPRGFARAATLSLGLVARESPNAVELLGGPAG